MSRTKSQSKTGEPAKVEQHVSILCQLQAVLNTHITEHTHPKISGKERR